MFRTIHPIAGALALLTVCTFWLSTAYSELTGDLDLIVLGHAHIPLLHEAAPSRFYINLGDWINHRSYLVLREGERPSLKRWEAENQRPRTPT